MIDTRTIGRLLARLLTSIPSSSQIGSLSWSVLPGKVMFRDVSYVTKDYTLRVQDGFLIFRWWLNYAPKDVSEDLSHSKTRVSIQLYGAECHVYNRTAVYRELEKKFGFESRFFADESERDDSVDLEATPDSSGSLVSSFILGKNWHDLIPVIKIDMTAAKLSFGNKLLPTSLVLSVEEAHCTYSTKPAACKLDHFMHFVKVNRVSFTVILVIVLLV